MAAYQPHPRLAEMASIWNRNVHGGAGAFAFEKEIYVAPPHLEERVFVPIIGIPVLRRILRVVAQSNAKNIVVFGVVLAPFSAFRDCRGEPPFVRASKVWITGDLPFKFYAGSRSQCDAASDLDVVLGIERQAERSAFLLQLLDTTQRSALLRLLRPVLRLVVRRLALAAHRRRMDKNEKVKMQNGPRVERTLFGNQQQQQLQASKSFFDFVGMASQSRVSPTTRRFFYHANALQYDCAKDVVDRELGDLLGCLARGADPTVQVRDVTSISPTFSERTLAEFALTHLLHPRFRPRPSLAVFEALLDYATSTFALHTLWYAACGWHTLRHLLVVRRTPFPPPPSPTSYFGGCLAAYWEIARENRAATRRAMHTRNVLLGGRGPAPIQARVHVPSDVWSVVFAFIL